MDEDADADDTESPAPDGEMTDRRADLIDSVGLPKYALIFRGMWENVAAMDENDEWDEPPRREPGMQRRWSQEALRERRRLREQLREAETPAERARLFAELTELEKDQRLVPVEDSDAASEDGADAEAVDPDV